jgi:hypothetical protein
MITRVTNDVKIAKLTGFLGEYCSKEGIRRCARFCHLEIKLRAI